MYRVIETAAGEDLSQFSRLLWQQKISHRIIQLEGSQVLAVPDRHQIQPVFQLFHRWSRGEIAPAAEDSASIMPFVNARDSLKRLLAAFIRAPVTLLFIVACLVLAILAPLEGMTTLTRTLLYPDFSYGTRIIDLTRVLDNFAFTDLLRMMSPILLHGGLVHLAFNMLWLWEFGRRIEMCQPSWFMLPLVAVIALVSNTGQFLYGGSIYFGGMSGVVYGLFGYIWMWQLFFPQRRLALPGALIFFFLLMLVVMTAINLSYVADEAHIGGLLAGVVYGAATATIGRIRYKPGALHD